MKRHVLPLFGVALVAACAMAVITRTPERPDNGLLGAWVGTNSAYEHMGDRTATWVAALHNGQLVDAGGDAPVLHVAETWRLTPDSLLLTRNDGTEEKLRWRLKGRGHVLQLDHPDGRLESYEIKELSTDRLVLHFRNDMMVRGIVKIAFRRETT